MASKIPPPYFPQSSLQPTDPNRYTKFKLIVAAVVIVALALLAAAGFAIYYLVRAFV